MKILFGILLAAGIAAIGLGLGPVSDHDRLLGFALAAAGFALTLAIAIWVPRFMNRREARQRDADVERATRVAEGIAKTGEHHDIGRRGSGLLLTLVLATATAGFGYFAFRAPSVPLIAFTLLGALFLFFAALIAIPALGAVPISMTREGMKTALYGFISWDQIEGLGLYTLTSRSSAQHYLELGVPDIDEHRSRMHPCGRMLRRFAFGQARSLVRFRLSRKDAVFAEHLAASLWEHHTGRKNVWAPGNRQLSQELQEQNELLAQLNRPSMLADPEKAVRLLERHRTGRDDA